jgi:hypothetical protein
MKNTNPVLDLFREDFDSYDAWGSVLSAHFDIAECLYRNGCDVPEEWEFSPSPFLMPGQGPTDDDSMFYIDIDLMLRRGHYSNLVHAGNVLMRYAAQLRLAGMDY